MCLSVQLFMSISRKTEFWQKYSCGWFLSIRDKLFLILLPSFSFLVMLNDTIQLSRCNSEKASYLAIPASSGERIYEQGQVGRRYSIESQGKAVRGSGSRKDQGISYANFRIYGKSIHIH